MFSFIVSVVVLMVGLTIMRSFLDDKRRLPLASTPEGKKARIIAGLVLTMFVGAFVLITVKK